MVIKSDTHFDLEKNKFVESPTRPEFPAVETSTDIHHSVLPDGAATEAKQDTQISILQQIEENTDELELNTDDIEEKLDTANTHLTAIEQSVSNIDQNTDTLESLITSTNSKLDDANTNLNQIEGYVDQIEPKLDTLISHTDDIENRIGATDETAAATDTSTSGLNGLFKRLLQRITTIITTLTDGTMRSRVLDTDGNGITSTLINSKQRIDANLASDGISGSAVPFHTTQVGGSDGTNLRAISTDTLGRLKLAGSSFFKPIFSLRVQAVIGNSPNNATSLVIPLTSSSISGNFIAVMVSSSVAGVISVTDNLGQVYSTAISGTSGTHTSYIFYLANTAAGVTSITINSTLASGLCGIVTEYFGIQTVSPFDKSSTATVVGTPNFNSGLTAGTTSPVELLLGSAHGATKNNQTYTPGTGWSSVGLANGFNGGAGQLYLEDQYVSVSGAYAATGTASGNDTIIGNIATFIVTNTNLAVAGQPKLVKTGPGILRRIIVNSIGTGSPTVTVYDNTTNAGTVIAVLALTAVGSVEYNLNFSNGLTIVPNTATGDFTLVYD